MAWLNSFYFDDSPEPDKVVFAVAPTDAFTGRIVSAGVQVRIQGLPDRPIRNRSGLQVFLRRGNLREPGSYNIRVEAEGAGYFNPDPVDFVDTDPDDEDVDYAERYLAIPLLRRPSFAYMDGETLISGVIVRGGDAVAGAAVWVDLPDRDVPENPPSNKQFRTKTDERGAFAFAIRLPEPGLEPNSEGDGASETIAVKLHVRDGPKHQTCDLNVSEGRRHVFAEPMDLDSEECPSVTDQIRGPSA